MVIHGPRRPQVSIEEFLCDRRSSTSAGATNTIARSQRSSPISSALSDGVYTPDVKASLLSRFTPPAWFNTLTIMLFGPTVPGP